MAVFVQCGTRQVEVESWSALAAAQRDERDASEISHDAASLERLPYQQPVAFYDRNCFEAPWRKVLVVRHNADDVFIYDELGAAIHEPDEGVVHGKTPLHGEEMTMMGDWEGNYYTLPRGPDCQPASAPEDETEKDDETGGETGDTETTPVAFVFDEKCVRGARIALCYGSEPAVWFGATIDEVDTAGESLLLAFDDADLKWRSKKELELDKESGCFRFLTKEEGGIRDGMTGVPAAARAARQKEGRAPSARPVGVLIGDLGSTLCGDPLYMGFYRDAEAVLLAEPQTDRAATRAGSNSSFQDRYGLHTFARGNVVKFVHCEQGEECEAAVVAVTWPEADSGPKFLLLMERASKAFFLSRYTDWYRSHSTADADVDNDDTAISLTDEECASMVSAFAASEILLNLRTKTAVATSATHVQRWGPPHVEQQRRERQNTEKQAARLDKAKERAELRKRVQTHACVHVSAARARPHYLMHACAYVQGAGGKNTTKTPRPKARNKRLRGPRGKDVDLTDPAEENGGDADLPPPLPAPAAAPAAAPTAEATAEATAALAALQEQNDKLLRLLQEAHKRPSDTRELRPARKTAKEVETERETRDSPQKNATADGNVAQTNSLPPGWRSHLDPTSGREYYYNHAMRLSQFQRPGSPPPLPPPPTQPPLPTQAPPPWHTPRALVPFAGEPSTHSSLTPHSSETHGPVSSGGSHSPASVYTGRAYVEDMYAEHNARAAYAPSDHVRAFHAAEAARLARRLERNTNHW